MKRRAVALLLLAGWAGTVAADDAAPVVLGLAETLERAVKASARLAQLQALERAAEADVRVARAAARPRVDVSASYTRNSDVPELTLTFPGQPPRTLFPNIPDNFRTRASLEFPLYTGGRTGAALDAANQESSASAQDTRQARADLVLETTTTYWSLLLARQSEQVVIEAVSGYDAHLHDAENRERFGLAPRNEVLAIQVERQRAELQRLQAAEATALGEANLARLLDLPAGTRIEPSEPLDGAAMLAEDLGSLVARALEARPERAALQARIAAAGARVRVERSTRAPQVSTGAGYDLARPNRKILPPEAAWDDTWDVSVGVTLNLFDGGRTSAVVARARAREDAARLALQDLERRIRLQVTERLLSLNTAVAAVTVADRALEAARENRKVAADRYREGVSLSSELLDAEIGLLRAAQDRTAALARVRIAAAQLDHAVGR